MMHIFKRTRCLKRETFYLRFLTLEAKKDALSIAHLLANTHDILLAHSDLSWKHLSLISQKKKKSKANA